MNTSTGASQSTGNEMNGNAKGQVWGGADIFSFKNPTL